MTNDAMPPMTDDQHSESNSRATLSLVIGYHTTQLASAAGIRFTPSMFRKDLIPLLLDNPLSVAQIARLVREEPRDIEADLLHLLKSLKHTEYAASLEPARCRKCGFEFDRGKLAKPSKCPECRSTWILEPRIGLSVT